GQFEEALAEKRQAQELDPLSLIISNNVAAHFYFARQYDQAITQAWKVLEMDPNFYVAHCTLGLAYEQKGMYEEAIAEFQQAITASGGDPEIKSLLGHAYALLGHRDAAQQVIDELQELGRQRYVSAYDVATIYTGL